ncbi:signal recognition particle protein [Chlamydiifrater phoenicopteri]|uniref:signal recognition particle protein n=1 Tax=Chlamydiifrater phoenicopteri TaxID=2681469 RepID=UPI001BCD48B6|nr:signal recognition particle protein [Chlamydiifrater phoenicopteri]
MFGDLSQKLSKVFSSFTGARRVTEQGISEAIREIRLALLDADVNYTSVKSLISTIKEKVSKELLLKSSDPGTVFLSCVRQEVLSMLSSSDSELLCSGKPGVILLCGLQGAGKTTTAAKLALFLSEKKCKKVLLVPCDLKRPAAVEQLKILGRQIGVDVFDPANESDPISVAKKSLEEAKRSGYDAVVLDTAGRLNVDDCLMNELESLHKSVPAGERLFVMNPSMGQDAVRVAKAFDDRVGITGLILSMTDGDAKGGCVLSIKEVLGKAIKFEGCGERVKDLREFDAESMADRIVGIGDVRSFMREVRELVSEEEDRALEEKLLKATFTYEDYYKQMKIFRRMGPLRKIMKMFPGFGGGVKEKELEASEKEFTKTEAMILSMTPEERKELVALDMRRMKRIALGAGVTIGDINQFRKKMAQSKKFFKGMTKEKVEQIKKKMSGGNKWR